MNSAAAEGLPDEAFVSGIAGHPQHYNLSCESRSAADWAAFMGTPVSEEEILFSLPSSDNPEVGFVGDVNGAWGAIPPNAYGVHAAPIAAALRAYGLPADRRVGMNWDEARAEIAAGRPMIVWIIGGMWLGTPVEYPASDGQTVVVARYEHSMILIGYSPSLVHVIDSYTGLQQAYSLSAFLASWATLGNQAVVATRSPERPVPPAEAGGGSYTVQRGDTLSALALRFGTSWQQLAAWNAIAYPYIVYTGQVLKVPGADAEPEPQTITEPQNEPIPAPTSTPEPVIGGPGYTVQRGDSLIELANRFQTSWDVLAELNGLNWPYWIYPGQTLQLPLGTSEPLAPTEPPQNGITPTPANTTGQTYVVQSGDHLMELARRFGVDWRSLAEWNGIEYPYVIHPGQELRIGDSG